MTTPEKTFESALAVLRNGGVLIFPTETSYGIGCDARNQEAVARVYNIKERSLDNPSPLVFANLEMVQQYAEFSEKALELAKLHWPGPLNLVLPLKKLGKKSVKLATPAIALDNTVATRVTSNTILRELSEKLAGPIIATSANKHGDPPFYTIKDVKKSLSHTLDHVDFIIDTGELEKNPPSTIVLIRGNELAVLRKGEIEI